MIKRTPKMPEFKEFIKSRLVIAGKEGEPFLEMKLVASKRDMKES